MKQFKYIALITLSANLVAGPSTTLLDEQSTETSQKTNWSKLAQNALYGTVLVGAAASLILWFPSTLDVISRYGVKTAIVQTYIPRLVLDGLTIGACTNGLYQTNSTNQDSSELPTVLSEHKSVKKYPVRGAGMLDTSFGTDGFMINK